MQISNNADNINNIDNTNNRALIAMSGGIDSSVTAFLMREQGYECIGATMKLFDDGDDIVTDKTCCSLTDVEDAKSVAYLLGMPHYVFNFKESFSKEVIARFVDAYVNGFTPNPCIDCNRFMKFERLLRRADELGCHYIATGHYAQIDRSSGGRCLLKKGADEKKDQSYVLYHLTQPQLARFRFPLGGLTKTEVRQIAAERGFVNAAKSESQDICFVPDGDYAAYIEKYTGRVFPDGDFIDSDGNVLGRHKGIIRYTNGQRRGLGLSLKEPMYVLDKNTDTNVVTLCAENGLYSKTLTARDINLSALDKIDGRIRVSARARYNQIEQPAIVEQVGEDELIVEFDAPQRAITKGQSVVLYDGDIVIGGGTIV